MQVELDYVDYKNAPFEERGIYELAVQTLRMSRAAKALEGKKVHLDVALVGDDDIRRVNREFRDKDAVTDVISIGEYSDNRDITQENDQEINLGELVLCWDFIQKSATIHNVEDVYEFAYVLSHGILHLLGYAHSEEMFALQDQMSVMFVDEIYKDKIQS